MSHLARMHKWLLENKFCSRSGRVPKNRVICKLITELTGSPCGNGKPSWAQHIDTFVLAHILGSEPIINYEAVKLRVDKSRILLKKEDKKEKKPLKSVNKSTKKAESSYAKFAAFYDSKKWQVLRYKVFKRDGKKCACCESTKGPFHIDHIKPRSKFPELELDIGNLQVLCEDCNMGKGGWDSTDWRDPTLEQKIANAKCDVVCCSDLNPRKAEAIAFLKSVGESADDL